MTARIHVTPQGQRDAAQPDRSVWVAASAGTGKTKVLVDRVLRHLLENTPPSRILCLTFTKAAAQEMEIRLAGELARWTAMPERELAARLQDLVGEKPGQERLAAARRLFARVIDAPGGFRIQTIHSFCQALLARFPLEAGVAPNFEVLDEAEAGAMLNEAIQETLAAAGSPGALAEALAAVARRLDEERFVNAVTELARERGKLRPAVERAGGIDAYAARIRAWLGVAPGASPESIFAAACRDEAFDGRNLRRAAKVMLAGSKRDRECGERMAQWLTHATARAEGFGDYALAYFTQELKPRKDLATKGTKQAAPWIEDVLAAEAERVGRTLDQARAARLAADSEAMVRLAHDAIARYQRGKAIHGALDYDDLILVTRRLLRRRDIGPWVLYKLDGGIDHVLIDEAQDTNPDQWQVIAALADDFFSGAGARDVERTVFAVGDPKQSIYSFQRADPAAFARMRDHFGKRARAAGRGWQQVELTVSFRSVPAIIAAVDAVVAQWQASPEWRDLSGGAITHDSHRRDAPGLVELWPVVQPDPHESGSAWDLPTEPGRLEPTHTRLARTIAATIRSWIERGDILEARGRPIRAGDVLVLVRRRNAFVADLVRALKQEGVEVAGIDRMVLAKQLAVMDLIALGRFLLLPEDDLTLAAVLKGPLFNFSEEQLFKVAHGREGGLWAALKARRAESPAFEQAAGELEELLSRADFRRPYEFYGDLLARLGGRRRIIARLGPEAEDSIDEFLAKCLDFERVHPPSLQAFLHWIEAGNVEVKRDAEAGQRDAVRIMTVHAAKGLQAPIVFLPDTVQTPNQAPNLLWSDDLALWVARQAGHVPQTGTLASAAVDVRNAEYRRLLYVAMTRAEDRLYVCGYGTRKDMPGGCWYEQIEPPLRSLGREFEFRSPVDPGHSGTAVRLEAGGTAAAATGAAAMQAGGTPLPPTWWGRRPAPEPRPARPLVPSAAVEMEPAVRSPFDADDGFRFRRGQLIHRLLQTLPDLAPGDRHAAARRYLGRRSLGLTAEAREALAAEALAVVEHKEFAALFAPGSVAEAPIVGVVGGRALSGQVDRLAVTEREVLIVDYKTNRPPPTDPEHVPPVYLAQMAAYRAALAAVFPGRQIRTMLLWTDGPRIMEIPAKLLEENAGFGATL